MFANLIFEIITKVREIKKTLRIKKMKLPTPPPHKTVNFDTAWPLMLDTVLWISSLILTTFGV